jgi:hypothetical protein
MPAFSLSTRRYATNEAGCWASFTFSGGWAEIAIVGWVARQAELGRTIKARRDGESDPLVHPALERLQTSVERPVGARLALSDAEIRKNRSSH